MVAFLSNGILFSSNQKKRLRLLTITMLTDTSHPDSQGQSSCPDFLVRAQSVAPGHRAAP